MLAQSLVNDTINMCILFSLLIDNASKLKQSLFCLHEVMKQRKIDATSCTQHLVRSIHTNGAQSLEPAVGYS